MMKSAPTPLAILARGEGARVWDVDGNRVPRLPRRHRRQRARPRASGVRGCRVAPGRAPSRTSRTTSRPRPQIELAERLTRLTGGAAGRSSATRAPRRSRPRSSWRGCTGPTAHPGARGLVPRPHDGLALADRQGGACASRSCPLLPGVEHIALDHRGARARPWTTTSRRSFVEPIKGEAGVVDLPAGYLEAARHVTQRHGALLILDEIQTGAGRTGDWFAFQHDRGIVPGRDHGRQGHRRRLPDRRARHVRGGERPVPRRASTASTFGGNPLATATANAVLGEIERAGLVGNARRARRAVARRDRSGSARR